MSPIQQQEEGWIQRLLQNPYDRAVLGELHAATSNDPQNYAILLEYAASMARDDAAASHFLTEAALVRLSLPRNSSQALVLLRRALDRDPLNVRAAERLTAAYRARNDDAALGSMLKGRAEALERLSLRDPGLTGHAADVYEALGIQYADNLGRKDLAVAALRRAIALLRGREPSTYVSPPPADDASPAESTRQSRRSVESALVPARAGPSEDASDAELATSPTASSAAPGPPTDPDFLRPTDATVEPGKTRHRRVSLDAPATPPPREGASEERLMGLFEALHAVRFCRDIHEACGLIVQIVRDALEAESAMLHLYDAVTREYVAMAALGAHHRTVVGIRTPETDPLFERATTAGTPVIVSPIAEHPLFVTERWTIVEAKRSVVCAMILDDGALLGAIELVDPKDGPAFDERDRDALTYVTGRVAEFITERGGFVG